MKMKKIFKIFRTIRLRRLKTEIINEVSEENLKEFENKQFYVLYRDDTYEYAWDTYALRKILEKDHIKPIQYIFDATDRIIVDRDIVIKESNENDI